MAWETINGRRYFYEITYDDGEQHRRSWGSGIEAQMAAARVEKEKLARAEDIAWVSTAKLRDRQIDQKIATLDSRVRKTIQSQLRESGYHYFRGQWRKSQRSKMNAKPELTELKNEVLKADDVLAVEPDESNRLSGEIRRLALESLRCLSNPVDGPRVTIGCNVDRTIAEIEAKVQSLRVDFQYEETNSFEKLLIDQLTTAWVHWYVASWLLDGELTVNRTWRQNQYYGHRYQQCQTRLTKSLDQLVRIRQIRESDLIRISRAEKEANVQRNRDREVVRAARFATIFGKDKKGETP